MISNRLRTDAAARPEASGPRSRRAETILTRAQSRTRCVHQVMNQAVRSSRSSYLRSGLRALFFTRGGILARDNRLAHPAAPPGEPGKRTWHGEIAESGSGSGSLHGPARCRLTGENSRGKVQNVCGDSSAGRQRPSRAQVGARERSGAGSLSRTSSTLSLSEPRSTRRRSAGLIVFMPWWRELRASCSGAPASRRDSGLGTHSSCTPA